MQQAYQFLKKYLSSDIFWETTLKKVAYQKSYVGGGKEKAIRAAQEQWYNVMQLGV